ncbi:MAG TPA: hypothetical protein ENJ12_01895 [Thiolapillus brandeum]|uniref:Uncharacterized protein n=1 Tax=Thiolapillus brandeum TaxID=1076588 RepID=A0A831RVA0_9GAMM|nr:hypothetical protein [Thiolapillus brandeum]
MMYVKQYLVALLLGGVIFPVAWIEGNAAGELDFMRQDPRIWKGSISIERSGSAEEHSDDSSQGNTDKHDYVREVKESLVLRVCGPLPSLYILDKQHSLSDVTEESSDKVAAKAVCVTSKRCNAWSCKRETRHPGDSRRIRKKTIVNLYDGPVPDGVKDELSAAVQMMPGGRYVITAGRSWYSSTLSDSVDRMVDACSGKKKVTEQHLRTGAMGEKAAMDTHRSEASTSTTIRMPPIAHLFAMRAEGRLDSERDIIAGEDIQESRVGSHGYEERVVSRWSLEGYSSCDEIYGDLRYALAAADAYSNAKIRDFASTVDEYESLITDRTSKNLTGRPHTPAGPGQPNSQVGNYMATDPKTCKILWQDEFHEAQRKSCQPPFLFQVVLDHEKEHARQCWDGNHRPPFDADAGTVDGVIARSQAETSAHLVEAGESLAWLRDNCPDKGYDLDGAQQRIDKIKARKAGWWD